MKTPYCKQTQAQTGSILLPFVIVLPFLILICAHFMSLAVSSFGLARTDQARTHAQLAADAGAEYALQQINQDSLWQGTNNGSGVIGSEITLHDNGDVRTTYAVKVDSPDADNKIVNITGRTYSPATSTTMKTSVSLKVNLRPVRSTFSIVTGVGGLYLSNNSKIVGGDVFVNGEVKLSNSAQIGLSTNPVNLQVAHQTCPNPADSTYPKLCASGENGQPITIEGLAHIYGEVKANNQTDGTGMSNSGLVASSGVTPQALPAHDRDAQKAAVTSSQTGTVSSCSSGSKTWAGKLKIEGNVTIGGSCKVTIEGDVWITGTLTMTNQGQIIVSESMDTTKPNIMVDGTQFVMRNGSMLTSNSKNTGVQIITYYSRATCSPDCASVTGVDLYNSRNDVTIELLNSAEAPHSVFYAKWSRVAVSNSGRIGALIGQTVALSNSGTITFGTSAGTDETYWVIDSYRRSY